MPSAKSMQQLPTLSMPPKPHAPPAKGKPVAKKDDAADKKARKKDIAVAGSEDTGPERIKPSKQVQGLTDADLNKEHTRVLSAKDPNAPDNVSRFSFKDRQFKLDAAVEQMFTHFEMEGCLVHKDTEEGRRIVSEADAEKVAAERAKENEALAAQSDHYEREDDSKQLRNQFNFSERASQTFNHPLRERGTVTEPPPSISFSATATQWEIFDACVVVLSISVICPFCTLFRNFSFSTFASNFIFFAVTLKISIANVYSRKRNNPTRRPMMRPKWTKRWSQTPVKATLCIVQPCPSH